MCSNLKIPKVCFINPPTSDPSDRQLYFPMALITLGGVIKKVGGKAELWDFDLYFRKVGNTTERDFRKLLRLGIDGVGTRVFGISAVCSNFPLALWISKEIKEYCPDSLVILGGPQPSSIPTEILKKFEFVDVVAIGEGEITLEEMARIGFDRKLLTGIPGLAVRENGQVKLTPKRPLVKNMDELPFPDYSLVNFEDYIRLEGKVFRADIEVGRGCPFHCTFCSTALMWENDYRVKSPRRIFQEMEALHQAYGFTTFDFIHDNFTTSKKFVLDFCEYMVVHNNHNFRWGASSRTDCIDVQRLEKMYSAGLLGLFFGIETGSERMQKIIRKGLNFDKFEPIIKRSNELGMWSTTAFIVGFPEETLEDLNESIKRALHYKALGTSNVAFAKLVALPGTNIYREHLDKFTEISEVSDMSPQDYGLPYVKKIIRDYPTLFSSFYHVPHSTLSSDFLLRISEFAVLLVAFDPGIILLIIEKLKLSPTELFKLWDGWAKAHGIRYYDFRTYPHSSFKKDFKDFLDSTIFKKAHVSPNLQVA